MAWLRRAGNKHTEKCNNHSDFLLIQAYSDRGNTAQMLVYTRMGVSSLKNSVSATDNWFLNSIPFICNRISKLCNIEIQEEKVT